MWKQGWCGGESASLPPLPPLWTGFRSWTWCHMWIEFVISSHPCSKGFSVGPPVFLPWQKTNILNSNSTWQKVDRKSHPTDCPLLISSYFFFECVCVCTAIHAGFVMFGTSHYIHCLGRGWEDFCCITLKLTLCLPRQSFVVFWWSPPLAGNVL